MQIQAPKGTKDVLPSESYKWQYVENEIRKLCRSYGVYELRTPVIEHTELFARGVGDTTDIVQKEMYTFKDKGDRSITLKPEGTAGMVRAFLENRLFNEAMPQKMFYLNAPVFRYEKPQAGRLREHHQFGVEFFGSPSYETDAEVIILALTLLKRLGIGELTLRINSIGCSKCRAEYNRALYEYLSKHIDDMCATCKSRLERNPMRIIDCKEERCKEICKGAPRTIDYLCDDCKAHFEGLKRCLNAANVDYIVDADIVRGLDYYGHIVFEVHAISPSGKDYGALLGGGHYDGMLQEFGGPKTMDHGVGFAMGVERLYSLLSELGKLDGIDPGLDLYAMPLGEESMDQAFSLVEDIRKLGYSVEMPFIPGKIGAMFKKAERRHASFALIIGKDELDKGVVQLKNLKTHEQIEASIETLDETLDEQFALLEGEEHHHH